MPESTRQRGALNLYCNLGARRSIGRLHAAIAGDGPAPNLRTLYEWSRRYHWQDRLADLERQVLREYEAGDEIFPRGYRPKLRDMARQRYGALRAGNGTGASPINQPSGLRRRLSPI